jgi:hypothetical protein
MNSTRLAIKLLLMFLFVNSMAQSAQEDLDHLDTLFLKYAQANNTMYSSQLKLFLKHFFGGILSEIETNATNSTASLRKINCMKSKANTFLNIATHLNDKIMINITNFNKLSSLLITNIDVCLSPQLSSANFTSNSKNETFLRSLFGSFSFEQLKKSAVSISLEGITYLE